MANKSTGVAPIQLSVKVDLDNANDKVKAQLSNMTKQVAQFYATTGRAMGAMVGGAAIGTIAGLGAAMALTVGAASRFEDSFAGIKKTVNASESEFKRLSVEIRELATNIPIATSQLNSIGELGGQLGVSTSGLPIFIDTIAKLGVATRLSTETAALSLARLQTIFQLPEQSVDNLASSLVDLGNNFAALEDEILSTALRLAAGAKVAGATVADTLAIATALQAVGVQSQAGGTAMARVFQAITIALQGGNKELTTFAQVTGMTNESFKTLAKEDPAQALNAFLIGLSEAGKSGRNVVEILEALGLKQQRTIRALLAVAEAGDLLTDTLNTANIAYDLNIALQEEANKRFETAKSQTKLMKNAFTELRIEMGNYFLPALKNILAGMTGLAESMTDAEKKAEGLSKGTMIVVGTLATIGAGIGFVIPGLVSLKIAALTAETGLFAFVKAGGIAEKTLHTYTMTQRAAIATGKLLVANIGLITAAMAALTVGFIINQAANVKARRSAEAYNKAISTLIPLTEKLRQSEQRLEDLRNQRNVQGNIVRIGAESSALKIATAQNEAYAESYEKVRNATNKAFLNIPKFAKDLSLEEATKAVDDFDMFLSQRAPLDELMQQEEDGSIFYIAPPELTEDFAKEFNITTDEAEKIIKGGYDTIRSFLQAQTIIDDKAFKKGGQILIDYSMGVNAAFGQTRVFNTYTDAQKELLESNQNFIQGFMTGAKRLFMLDSETEMIMEGQTEMFEQYKAMREENSNLPEISEIEFFQDPEATMTVFKAINGLLDDMNTELEETVDIADDILNKFYDALDPLKAIKGTLEDFPTPEFVDIADMEAANQKAKDLQTILSSGVFQLIKEGYPALALSFAEGGLEAENMGQLIAIINDGVENNRDILQERNDSLIDASDDYADFAMLTEDSMDKVVDTLDTQYGITKGILSVEQERESINRILGSIQKEVSKDQADFLAITKQIIQDERNIVNLRQELVDLQQEITDLEADLVYDNITITNAKRDQVEKAEALAELNQVIAEFGREGVKTNVENLNLLQMELNISRMQDQLENKMDKRRQKSLRDKKKEVKFLELAVEQGVVDQLDLDAAREELSEMQNPLTQKEIDILTLQKDIAQAEYDAAKARAEGLSPQVISAIENYNTALNVTKDREKEIADLQKDIEEKTADLNIELAENAQKYQEIMDKYPDFKNKITEVASMIGIPDEMLNKALDNMGKTVDDFIGYVDYAKAYASQNLAGFYDPDKFVNPKQYDYGSWETSDAYRSIFGDASKGGMNYISGPSTQIDPNTGFPYEGQNQYMFQPTMGQGLDIPSVNSIAKNVNDAIKNNPLYQGNAGSTFSSYNLEGTKIGNGINSFMENSGANAAYNIEKFFKGGFGANKDTWQYSGGDAPKGIGKQSNIAYNIEKFFKGGFGENKDTWMNNYTGGNVPMGRTSIVGERGPEVIMSTPGGTSVFSNKTGGYGAGVNIENMNLNITGLPADPITARKVAQNIRKELIKLEKEGQAGTGLVNR